MSQFTKTSPGSRLEIRQLHSKGISIEGKVYYGRSDDGSVLSYIGTKDGRLKEYKNYTDEIKNIDFDNNKPTNIGYTEDDGDAVTKKYYDDTIFGKVWVINTLMNC
jgi:hypothetical protein